MTERSPSKRVPSPPATRDLGNREPTLAGARDNSMFTLWSLEETTARLAPIRPPDPKVTMDFSLSPELRALAADAAACAERWSERRPFPEDSWLLGHDPDIAREMGDRGWIGMTWPTTDGGGGRSPLERFVVFEQLIAGGAPIAAMYIADRQMGPSLLQFGTPEQRRRWLPDMLAGRSMWCIGMSEPDNGSDLANLRTRAVKDGRDWRITGQKVWTSGAAMADWIYLVARTDPTTAPHAGLSEFVVDMTSPGIDIRPIRDLTGNRHFCEVSFEDVLVPGDNLVGEPNGSFRQLMRQLEHERGGIDRLVTNRRLMQDMRAAGVFDTTDPLVRQRLARLETLYRIGRLLVLREVMRQAPKSFSAATKTFCTSYAQELAAACSDAAGAQAMVLDEAGGLGSRAARAVCYARAYSIMGGTDEVLRNILGERVLGLPR